MSPFPSPPTRLVEEGRPRHGRFAAAPRDVNLLDARLHGLPRALRGLRMKRWQATQVFSEALLVHVALFDARTLGMLQVRLYDRARDRQIFHERLLRPGALRVATSLDDSTTAYEDRRSSLSFVNRAGAGRIDIALRCAASRAHEALDAHLRIDMRADTHQVACMPLSNGGAMYAHKGMFPVEGALTLGAHTFSLRPRDGLALLDHQLGTYPYVMEWDWATAAVRNGAGVAHGFNLTRNQCAEPHRYDENCAWRDGRVAPLPPVRFTREEASGQTRWRVRDLEGRVDLTFMPRVAHDVRVNALIVESRYQGPLGTFSGRLVPVGMAPLEVEAWLGMGERFWLRC